MAIFNIKDYGAVADDLGNDTLAIRSAITAAYEAGGGEVYIPEGTYILSADRGAALTLRDNVSLVGDGMGLSILKMTNWASFAMTSLVNSGSSNNVGLSNLTLDGNRDFNNSVGTAGWENGGASNVKIDGVEAKNFSGAGLELNGWEGLGSRQIEVSNSVLHDNDSGIEALIMSGGVLQNNVAYGNNFGFNVGGDVQLEDNVAYDNALNGILVRGSGTTVSGGEVYDNGTEGILVKGSNFAITGVDSHGNQDSGIALYGGTNGTVSNNTVHNNSLGTAGPEIELTGPGTSASANNTVSHNIITGSEQSTYGIVESQAANNNVITDNVISHTTQGSIVAATGSEVSGNTDSILAFGSRFNDMLSGDITRDLMFGGAGNDTLNGGSNDDTLVGGTGVDKLTGGVGDDVFRFTDLTDSYRTSTKSYADVITDFDVAHDKIDLASSALPLTVLGDGHNGTLLLAYNEARDVTYLKNYDQDSLTQRFELALSGNYLNTFTNANLQARIDGTNGNDTRTGSSGEETLLGGAGRDILNGAAGDDRLNGGPGGDTLTGGAGADTFVFTNASDSLKVGSSTALRDTITDFNALENDKIDLTGLNFTGLGNGHDGTLKMVLNAAGTLTALKSLDVASDGSSFEIMLTGNHFSDLNANNVIFNQYSGTVPVDSGVASATPITLLGVTELQHELMG